MQEFTKQEIEAARKLGLPEKELVPYLRAKREGFPQLRPGQPSVVVDESFTANLKKTAANSACTNGGFELGNFTNWNGSYGTLPYATGPINLNSFTPGFATNSGPSLDSHAIMPVPGWPLSWQAPFDPLVGMLPGKTPIPIPVFPNGGNHMLRLGNPNTGRGADTASYSFFVTQAQADFRFRYALVLEDPHGHPPSQKPFFEYWIRDLGAPFSGSGGGIVDYLHITPNPNDPFFEFQGTANGPLAWRRVSCHRVDLTPYIGHTVLVFFMTGDCRLNVHYGYAYIDGLCETDFNKPVLTMENEYCVGKPIMADGTKTEGETQHTWSVVETDAAGNNPVGGTLASETFQGQITAPKDLRAWYLGKGKTFTCGKYYKVTLTTNSECSAGDQTSKVIRISCPPAPVITGPATTCESGVYSVNPEPGTTYNWIIGNGVASPTTGPSVTVNWSTPNAGSVVVSATNACGSKAVILKVGDCKDKCCAGAKPSAQGGSLTTLGGATYSFNPILKSGPPNVAKVTATLLSTSIAYPSAACGADGPASSYVIAPGTLPLFSPPTVAVPYGREIVWNAPTAPGVNIAAGKVFPFRIKLPPGPGPNCTDIVTFCVKYTFTDVNCKKCELVVCYSFKRFPLINGFEPQPQPVTGPPSNPTAVGSILKWTSPMRLDVPGWLSSLDKYNDALPLSP